MSNIFLDYGYKYHYEWAGHPPFFENQKAAQLSLEPQFDSYYYITNTRLCHTTPPYRQILMSPQLLLPYSLLIVGKIIAMISSSVRGGSCGGDLLGLDINYTLQSSGVDFA